MIEKKNILVVDDESLVVETISEILADIVDVIYTASNGVEALEVLNNQSDILCVICDINMPEKNGIQTIKEARENSIEVPFIFYTAHGEDELIKAAAQYGIFDFLLKPKLENLVATVKSGLIQGFEIKEGKFSKEENSKKYEALLHVIENIE